MKSVQIDDDSWKKMKIESIETGLSLKDIIASRIGDSRFYVYKLLLKDGGVYIGFTSSVFNRIHWHRSTRDVSSISILKSFDDKQEALAFEKFTILNTDNINITDIRDVGVISPVSTKYSNVLYNVLFDSHSSQKNLIRLSNGYINVRILTSFCSKLKGGSLLLKRKFDAFEQEISNKDNIDFSNLVVGGAGDTDLFMHPLLAFDLARLSSAKARVEFISFACDMLKNGNDAIEVGIAKAKETF